MSNQITVFNAAVSQFTALPKEYRQRGQECMRTLQESAEAFDVFLAEVKQELEERRAVEHEAAVRAIRQQMEVVEEVQQKVEKAEFRAMTARNELSTAGAQLRMALDSKPKRYPLKEELAAWEDAVQKAREICERLEQKAIQTGALPQSARQALAQEQYTLRELEVKEFELRPQAEQETAMRTGFAPVAVSHGLQGERTY
jgi:glutamate synthase domain-containing protein 2